jgi:hypothetical protein
MVLYMCLKEHLRDVTCTHNYREGLNVLRVPFNPAYTPFQMTGFVFAEDHDVWEGLRPEHGIYWIAEVTVCDDSVVVPYESPGLSGTWFKTDRCVLSNLRPISTAFDDEEFATAALRRNGRLLPFVRRPTTDQKKIAVAQCPEVAGWLMPPSWEIPYARRL